MATYESYKDSGVKWLGLIPSHWEVKKLRAFFDRRNTKVSDTEFQPLSVTKKGIVPQMENVAKSKDSDNRRLVKIGDFVINSRSDRKGSSGVSSLEGSVSFVNTIMTPRHNVVTTYCNYLLKSVAFVEENYRNGHGIVADLWTTSFDEQKLIKLAMPPIQEQKAIVAYLDKVTAEIDRAVEGQQKMIDALNERKQIIITRAVTRGLNPDAPLRDSGIDWLGKIPEHWEIKKLKTLSDIKGRIGFRGYTNSDLVEQGEGAITLSPSNIVNGKMSYNKCSYLSWHKYFESPEIMVANGHILFVKTGSSYGKTAFVTDLPMEATINPQFSLIKPKKVNPYFLNYAISSKYFKLQVERGVIGSTIPTISQSAIGNMLVLTPPLSEQISIIEYLNAHFDDLDSIISNCERMIFLFQERKQIIINEVVTGKTKVI